MTTTTLELHSLKELSILRDLIRQRMDYLREEDGTHIYYTRKGTFEYLTLGQILVRLPEPAMLTPQTCTEGDFISWR